MENKLNLDPKKIENCRNYAKQCAESMQKMIDANTTVTVERTIIRLLGVDGVDDVDRPLPNVVVDALKDGNLLNQGAALWMGSAIRKTGLSPQEIAERIGAADLDVASVELVSDAEAREAIKPYVDATIAKIDENKKIRQEKIDKFGYGETPLIYVLCATGNIYDDVVAAESVAKAGADIISVIRTTAQSLLAYVPYGATTEGYGGTYATQENIRIMREAMDKVSDELGRYVRVCNFSSGLCMPEIAAMGAVERLDVLLNDAFYGILFRDINMQRTLIDQYFSRVSALAVLAMSKEMVVSPASTSSLVLVKASPSLTSTSRESL